LASLEKLDLSNNDLLYGLPDSFVGLSRLQTLDLSSNLLREVLPCDRLMGGGEATQGRICFGGVNTALRTMKLDYNYITHVNGEAVEQFINPDKLSFDFNQIGENHRTRRYPPAPTPHPWPAPCPP